MNVRQQLQRAILRGRAVTIHLDDETIFGVVEGIDDDPHPHSYDDEPPRPAVRVALAGCGIVEHVDLARICRVERRHR